MNLQQQFEEDSKNPVITDKDLDKIAKLAKMQLEKEKEVAQQEQFLEQLKEELMNIQENQLPDAMNAIGLEEFKLKTGERITVKKQIYASITKANQQAAFAWLRENNFSDIIKQDIIIRLTGGEDDKAETILKILAESKDLQNFPVTQKPSVHAGTLKSLVKEQREKGVEFPGCFSIYDKEVSIIK